MEYSAISVRRTKFKNFSYTLAVDSCSCVHMGVSRNLYCNILAFPLLTFDKNIYIYYAGTIVDKALSFNNIKDVYSKLIKSIMSTGVVGWIVGL